MSIQSWRKPRTRLSSVAYAEKMFEAIDTPHSLACYMLLKYGEHDQLADLSANPSNYLSAADFFLDYQSDRLLAKYDDLAVSADPRDNAIKKFIEAEDQCSITNHLILNGSLKCSKLKGVNSVFNRVIRKVSLILGEVPKIADLDCRFGPGAAYGVRKETSVYNKVTSEVECTFAMVQNLDTLSQEYPSWLTDVSQNNVALRNGSDLTFVPKNAKTHRSICIEPLLNGFLQKGVGSYIRKRLRRFGINLNDQGVNQKLASIAHISGLSTVDFSSASDTISYALVLELLPIDWFELLESCRCPQYHIEGNWYDFSKFTSMGNAYTFELETLIFYALATAVCEELGIAYETGENLSVYGDDVIIPRAAFDLFREVSSLAGFTINQSKTCVSGNFFESCGEDYFGGLLVRPFFLKKKIGTIEEMILVTNKTLEIAGTLESLIGCQADPRLSRVYAALLELHAWCIGSLPRKLRLLGPTGSGHGCLHSDFDVAVPPKAKWQWCGYRYKAVSSSALQVKFNDSSVVPMSYALYFAGLGCTDLNNSRDLYRIPESLDNGSGYTLRNRNRLSISWKTWFGHWPAAPTRWSERAIALCSTARKVKHRG